MISHLKSGLALLRPAEFAIGLRRCPFCGPSVFVRLRREAVGVRCVRCAASAIHLAIGWTLRDTIANLAECDVCELSARGPLVDFLSRNARTLATSEYFADAPRGALHNGTRCEDVQDLTYADATFDLVTHTEVLEHVPDDRRAFAELFRVLRPGGTMIFTVPMHTGPGTVERARIRDGRVEHLLEPVLHYDPLRREGILAFRDYGSDILDRLRDAGFVDSRIMTTHGRVPWLADSPIIVARKTA
jgi:SAM-dependent methyltransferase